MESKNLSVILFDLSFDQNQKPFEKKFETDRQTDKCFDTIYGGMWIFLLVKFAGSLLASLAGGQYDQTIRPYLVRLLKFCV